MPPKRQLNASASDEPRRSARASVKPSLLLDESGSGKETAKPAKKIKTSAKPKKTAKETASKAKPSKSATKAQPKTAVKKAPTKPAAKKEALAKKVESEEEKPSDASDKAKDSTKLKVGDMLPEITLKDQSGADVDLHAVAQESGLVIFSYPAASTPGCTSQACSYRDEYAAITGKGFKVYGLSTDTVNAQEKFKMKQNLQYPLLSDSQKQLLSQLGGTASGKKTARRCHWVVAKGGKLASVEIDVKPKDCVSTALKTIASLS